MLVEVTGRVSPFLGDKANKLGWMIPQETGEGGDVSKGAWSRQLEEAKRDSINTGGRLQATDNRSSLMVTTMAQKYGRQLLQLPGLIYIILNYHM